MITSIAEGMKEFTFIFGLLVKDILVKPKNWRGVIQELLKAAESKKLRVRVWLHSIGEYLYILSRSGVTLTHRVYTINQEDKDLLEWQGGKNP